MGTALCVCEAKLESQDIKAVSRSQWEWIKLRAATADGHSVTKALPTSLRGWKGAQTFRKELLNKHSLQWPSKCNPRK